MSLNDLLKPSLILDPYALHARNISLQFTRQLPIIVPSNDRPSGGYQPLNPTDEKPVGILGAGE